MPSAHRRCGKWTPGGLIATGERIGSATAAFFQAVMADRPHPEQGFCTCLGILSLAKSYGNARVDAACQRAILIKARTVASIRSILKNGLDRASLEEMPDHQPPEPRQHPRPELFPLNYGDRNADASYSWLVSLYWRPG